MAGSQDRCQRAATSCQRSVAFAQGYGVAGKSEVRLQRAGREVRNRKINFSLVYYYLSLLVPQRWSKPSSHSFDISRLSGVSRRIINFLPTDP